MKKYYRQSFNYDELKIIENKVRGINTVCKLTDLQKLRKKIVKYIAEMELDNETK